MMLPRVLPPRSLQIQRQLRRCNATEHSLPVYDQRYVPAEVQTGGAQIHFDLLRVPSTDANSGGLRSRRVALMAFACCDPARTMPPPPRSGRNPSKFGQTLLLALTLLCCTVMWPLPPASMSDSRNTPRQFPQTLLWDKTTL